MDRLHEKLIVAKPQLFGDSAQDTVGCVKKAGNDAELTKGLDQFRDHRPGINTAAECAWLDETLNAAKFRRRVRRSFMDRKGRTASIVNGSYSEFFTGTLIFLPIKEGLSTDTANQTTRSEICTARAGESIGKVYAEIPAARTVVGIGCDPLTMRDDSGFYTCVVSEPLLDENGCAARRRVEQFHNIGVAHANAADRGRRTIGAVSGLPWM